MGANTKIFKAHQHFKTPEGKLYAECADSQVPRWMAGLFPTITCRIPNIFTLHVNHPTFMMIEFLYFHLNEMSRIVPLGALKNVLMFQAKLVSWCTAVCGQSISDIIKAPLM